MAISPERGSVYFLLADWLWYERSPPKVWECCSKFWDDLFSGGGGGGGGAPNALDRLELFLEFLLTILSKGSGTLFTDDKLVSKVLTLELFKEFIGSCDECSCTASDEKGSSLDL